MKTRTRFIISLLGLTMLLLSACERSMTTEPIPLPTATATASLGFEEELPTEDPIQLFYTYATQTAEALGSATIMTPETAVPGTESVPTEGASTESPVIPTTGADVIATPTVWLNIPTATPGLLLTYTLQPREFPYCIARRFNLDPEELLALNNLTDGQLFQPGLELKIPQSGKTFPGERALIPHPATYTVQANDTIYSIACAYGDVDPMMIAYANGLTPPYTLTVGQVLNIP